MKRLSLVLLAGAVLLSALPAHAAYRSAASKPVRFFADRYNQSNTIKVKLDAPNTPVAIAGGKLTGVADAVPANAYIKVLRNGAVVASGQAAADGSFALTATTMLAPTDFVEVNYKTSPFTTGFARTETSKADFSKQNLASTLATDTGEVKFNAPYSFMRGGVAATPRLEVGKFGSAVRIEEGTTNNIPSQDKFLAYQGAAATYDAPTKIWTVTVPGTEGRPWRGLLLQDTGANVVEAAGSTITFSAEVYADEALPIVIDLNDLWTTKDTATNDNRVPNSEINWLWPYYTVPGQWTRIYVTYTVNSEQNYLAAHSISLDNAFLPGRDVTFKVRNVQHEVKPYPTPFTEGTRSTEVLTVPKTDVVPLQQGTVEAWAYIGPDFVAKTKASPVAFLDHRGPNATNFIKIGTGAKEKDGDHSGSFEFGLGDAAGKHSKVFAPNDLTIGWHHFVGTWSADVMRLYIDGIKKAEMANPRHPEALAYDIYVGGSGASVGEHPNTLLDGVRMRDVFVTDAEVQAAYSGGAPGFDLGTIFRPTFDAVNETEGALVSKTLDVSAGTSSTATISWNATAPAGTTLAVETSVSLDGGATWGAWNSVATGQTVPGAANANLSNARLRYLVRMTTSDPAVSPSLNDISVSVSGS